MRLGEPMSPSSAAADTSMHRRMIVVVGAGFVIDSFDIFLINIAAAVLSSIYAVTAIQSALLAASTLVGATLGQFSCGFLVRKFGKGVIFVSSMTLIVVAMSGIIFSFQTSVSIYWPLIVWRLVLGVGIGFEYPLSASITADFVKPGERHPGRKVVAIFSMQGIGNTVAPVVVTILLAVEAIPMDTVWRLAFVVPLLPSIALISARWKLHRIIQHKETTLIREEALTDVSSCPCNADGSFSGASPATVDDHKPTSRLVYLNLFGCCATWLLFDVAFYGTSLFSATVIEVITGVSNSHPSRSELIDISIGTFVIALIGLPGYWVSTAFIDRIGARRVQYLGFSILTAIYFILGTWLEDIRQNPFLFIFLFGLSFFFSNFGPNASTFLLPVQLFSVEQRTNYHGYAAAAGKIGAIIGSFSFKFMMNDVGLPFVLMICALTSFLGLLCTIFSVIPPKPSTASVATAGRGEEAAAIVGDSSGVEDIDGKSDGSDLGLLRGPEDRSASLEGVVHEPSPSTRS